MEPDEERKGGREEWGREWRTGIRMGTGNRGLGTGNNKQPPPKTGIKMGTRNRGSGTGNNKQNHHHKHQKHATPLPSSHVCQTRLKPIAKAPSVFHWPVWSLKNRHLAPRMPPHDTSCNVIGVVYAMWLGKFKPAIFGPNAIPVTGGALPALPPFFLPQGPRPVSL